MEEEPRKQTVRLSEIEAPGNQRRGPANEADLSFRGIHAFGQLDLPTETLPWSSPRGSSSSGPRLCRCCPGNPESYASESCQQESKGCCFVEATLFLAEKGDQ